jgi:hypothetical protein
MYDVHNNLSGNVQYVLQVILKFFLQRGKSLNSYTQEISKPTVWLNPFSGGLEKLQKESINFAMSVCPSAWSNSSSIGRISTKFCI